MSLYWIIPQRVSMIRFKTYKKEQLKIIKKEKIIMRCSRPAIIIIAFKLVLSTLKTIRLV